jgi:hypothetical protein
MGALNLHQRLADMAAGLPRVGLLVTPVNADVLKKQLDPELTRMGSRPLSAEERDHYAERAAMLLVRVASHPGSPFEGDLAAAGPALVLALNTPAASQAAATALADVPGVDAQRGLADLLLDSTKPAPLRLIAANQLARSIQRFGRLVTATQEKQLLDTLGSPATEPELRTALASVIGALRPRPASVGERLQTLTSPAAAAPVAPAPAPAVAPPRPPAPEAAPASDATVPPPADTPAPKE